jgi:hypothetical protein
MKISKTELNNLIKEEVSRFLGKQNLNESESFSTEELIKMREKYMHYRDIRPMDNEESEYNREVTDEVSEQAGMDNSDAQGVCEIFQDYIDEQFETRTDPKEVASIILKMSSTDLKEGFLDSFKRDIIPMETEKELNRLSKKYNLEYELYEDNGIVYIEIMNPDTALNFFSKITIVNIYKNGLMTLADDDVSKKYKIDYLEKAFKYLKCKYNKEKGKIEQKLKKQKETSYEEELNEEKTVLPIGYKVGVRVKDSEGNEFVIRDVVSNGVTLKGAGGEKEVSVSSLKHYNIIDKLTESKKDPKAEIRNRGDVVFPAGSKYVKDDKDHFPINNEAQARNALARANQYKEKPEWYKGTLDELLKRVHRAVKFKYKNIEVTEKSLHPGKD